MTYYSRYRRQPISDNAKAIIAAIVVCLCWGYVSEIDYQEAVNVEQVRKC